MRTSRILSEIIDFVRRELPFGSSPFEFHFGGVQGVVGEDKALALFGGQPVFDEVEIKIFISAVKFVADDGMAEVGQMDANLVFAASVRADPQQGGRNTNIGRPTSNLKTRSFPEFGLGGSAVWPDAVFDGNSAGVVFAKRRVDDAVVVSNGAVDEGEVAFFDIAVFPNTAQFAGGGFGFGDEDDAAGFTVQTVD